MMNKQQKRYAMAKAKYQLAKDEVKAYEHAFIIRKDVHNGDGSVPDCLWAMDEESDELFNSLCDELENDKEYLALCNAETQAYKNFQAAEESLIDYGLSLPMPENIRKTLSEHRKDYKVRDRLIDLTFRLNTRTVKAGG